jgi:hypothetical protein
VTIVQEHVITGPDWDRDGCRCFTVTCSCGDFRETAVIDWVLLQRHADDHLRATMTGCWGQGLGLPTQVLGLTSRPPQGAC